MTPCETPRAPPPDIAAVGELILEGQGMTRAQRAEMLEHIPELHLGTLGLEAMLVGLHLDGHLTMNGEKYTVQQSFLEMYSKEKQSRQDYAA